MNTQKSGAQDAQPVLYTISEVMGILRLSRTKVYQIIWSRELGSVQIGKSRRVPQEALERFLQRAAITPKE